MDGVEHITVNSCLFLSLWKIVIHQKVPSYSPTPHPVTLDNKMYRDVLSIQKWISYPVWWSQPDTLTVYFINLPSLLQTHKKCISHHYIQSKHYSSSAIFSLAFNCYTLYPWLFLGGWEYTGWWDLECFPFCVILELILVCYCKQWSDSMLVLHDVCVSLLSEVAV